MSTSNSINSRGTSIIALSSDAIGKDPISGHHALTYPKRKFAAGVSLVVCAILVACSTSTDLRRDDSVSVTLTAAQINAGQTGRALLTPVGERTQVTIIVSGVPTELSSRPVHLYAYVYRGFCGNLASDPSYALTEHVLAQSPTSPTFATMRGPLSITNMAPISIDTLNKDGYAILVKTSAADGNREIFCGNIPGSIE